MAAKKVAVFVGSLRKDSYTRKVAKTLIGMAAPDLQMDLINIGQLPLYDQDLDEAPPQAYTEFRQLVRGYDAFLFCTPEYNRSIPAALKNALDVGSRPYGQSVWAGKPGAIVSVTPGALGAFGANHHLRQCMVFLDVPLMQQPEAYLNHIGKQFDGDQLTDDSTRAFLEKYMRAFENWIRRNTA